ncbi:MAG: FAD-dependent oxidoreductase [Candidatus Nanoarchaeia archaeon]|nr:FAD-dependent oxidoreductase [Candidatus Nanoarchaeia archaeon]
MYLDYDVVIIGAGPAGLFAGYTLLGKKVAIIEKGKAPHDRNCPLKNNYHCGCCNPCNIMSGVGGAGLFSDGKLNFIPKLGKTNLVKILGDGEKAKKLIEDTEDIFNEFGMNGDVYPKDMQKALEIKKKALKEGVDLLLIKQKHLGSDKLPEYITEMMDYLKKGGLEFILNEEVKEFIVEDNQIKGVKTNKQDIKSKYVIACPGRVGEGWLYKECQKLGILVNYRGVEIGVRVEVPNEIMDEITDVIYDPTFFINSSCDDQVRTFCTNKGGFVSQEYYKDFVCVNGHAEKDRKSKNTNFALLSKVTLTEPVTDGYKYGASIGQLATTIGGGKPIIQRFVDLKKSRRSTPKRLSKSYVEPTLTDVTPGDISMAMSKRIVTNIIEGIEKLDKVIPGIASDATLLYAPEIKFFCNEIENECLKTSIDGLYVAGDGAGVSGNIVSSAATGVLAGRRILEEIN